MLIYLSTCQKKNQMTKKKAHTKNTQSMGDFLPAAKSCVWDQPACNGSMCISLAPAACTQDHDGIPILKKRKKNWFLNRARDLKFSSSDQKKNYIGGDASSEYLFVFWLGRNSLLVRSKLFKSKGSCFFFASLLGTVLWAFDQARARKQRIDNLFSDKMVANAPHKQWQRSTVNMYAHNRLGGA